MNPPIIPAMQFKPRFQTTTTDGKMAVMAMAIEKQYVYKWFGNIQFKGCNQVLQILAGFDFWMLPKWKSRPRCSAKRMSRLPSYVINLGLSFSK